MGQSLVHSALVQGGRGWAVAGRWNMNSSRNVGGWRSTFLGARFLTVTEARRRDSYRRRGIGACAEEAHYARRFDGGWPNGPHRTDPCATARRRAWGAVDFPLTPSRPGRDTASQWTATATGLCATGTPSRWRDDRRPGVNGSVAGSSAGLVREVLPHGGDRRPDSGRGEAGDDGGVLNECRAVRQPRPQPGVGAVSRLPHARDVGGGNLARTARCRAMTMRLRATKGKYWVKLLQR